MVELSREGTVVLPAAAPAPRYANRFFISSLVEIIRVEAEGFRLSLKASEFCFAATRYVFDGPTSMLPDDFPKPASGLNVFLLVSRANRAIPFQKFKLLIKYDEFLTEK